MNVTGSCLCGKVKYEARNSSGNIDHCHCRFCQKSHGAAFGTYLEPVGPDDFSWTAGKELVGRYQSSSHSARLFCTHCGTSLLAEINGGELLAPALGTVDDEVVPGAAMHMFWSSRVSWLTVEDDLPKHETYPPHMQGFTPTD